MSDFEYDVYLFGMVLMTNSFLLKGDYPEADSYGEFTEKYFLPGGETGTCATVLSSLGVSVKMDGNHLGWTTYPPLRDFYSARGVDITSMTWDPSYAGLQDYVLIGGNTRTCIGEFQRFYSDPTHGRWNQPKKEDIAGCRIAAIDPYFFDATVNAVRYCHALGKRYVTIDCGYDTEIHQYSEVNVISREFIQNTYRNHDIEELFRLYTSHTNGLVIFTFGSKDTLYGRKDQPIKTFKPFRVNAVSTLGAGDTFKAGVAYGILKEMSDDDIVRFACATAAAAVSSFPIPLKPPVLDKINTLIETGKLL
jgi:sugar/nucleoside kinase (ribokinase family)